VTRFTAVTDKHWLMHENLNNAESPLHRSAASYANIAASAAN
jgi:hypothetical protein